MLTTRSTGTDGAIAALLDDPAVAPCIVAHRELEPRPPRYAAWPATIDPRIADGLRARGVEAPYTHQGSAYAHAVAHRNVVVVTPTASGKTLCYNLPVLDAIAQTRRRGRSTSSPPRPSPPTSWSELRALADAERDRPQDPHLRRRHAAERAQRRAGGGPGRDHQPGHAPRRHPPPPHQVVQALREPAVRGDRRAAHVPRRCSAATSPT